VAKPKRRKATLHSAGKVTEQDLLERARELAEEPALAMPICEGGCVLFSPVKAANRAIPRIAALKDDEAALQKAANRGNDLARAYAATLLLAKAGKVPVVADIKLGGELVPYVARGKTKPFFLAGLQHHDDRALRLLSVASWTKKRGMHFYSTDRGIVCTGKRAEPPADFIAEEAELLGLAGSGTAYSCGHDGEDGVLITWKASGVTFARCASCAEGGSTLATLLKHIAAPRPANQFEVAPRLAPLVGATAPLDDAVAPELREEYARGRVSDAALLEAARAARVAALKQGERQFVAGNVSYGGDADAFLRAIGAGPEEERALRAAFAAHTGAVVVDKPTLARAVSELWPQHGRLMLSSVSDEATATKLHKEKPAPDEAVELVRKAARAGAGQQALAGLPTYAQLPPAASAADAIARAFRGQGRDAAVRTAQQRADVAKAKGVALAMLTALGARQGQDWRFTGSDRDVAESLGPYVESLLRGSASAYHDALVATSRGAGETAEIERR
jgi:hypothetical protein